MGAEELVAENGGGGGGRMTITMAHTGPFWGHTGHFGAIRGPPRRVDYESLIGPGARSMSLPIVAMPPRDCGMIAVGHPAMFDIFGFRACIFGIIGREFLVFGICGRPSLWLAHAGGSRSLSIHSKALAEPGALAAMFHLLRILSSPTSSPLCRDID